MGFSFLAFGYTFISYFPHSFIQALLFAFFATIPGLIIIVLLEFVLLSYQKYEEDRVQTHLLQEILKELKSQKQEDLDE